MAALVCMGTVWAETTTIMAPGSEDDYPYAHKMKAWSSQSHANDKDADGEMCWAATTANLIEYWQNRYCQLTGQSLPTGVPSGSDGSNRASQVFDAFVNAWENVGKGEEPGLYWYFSGAVAPYQAGAVTSGSGGYWKDYCDALGYGSTYNSLITNSYYKGLYATVPTAGDPSGWQSFVYGGCGDFIRNALESGSLVALTVNSGGTGHAITLYGADYDENGTLVAVWVNDNNSSKAGLTRYELEYAERSVEITFEDKDKKEDSYTQTINYNVLSLNNGNWTIQSVGMLDLAIVPEPSAATLSLLALAGLVLRRRRATV